MKLNERGYTLVDLLVWFIIMAILSTIVGGILKLQMQSKNETDVAKFYDELSLVDSYITEMNETSVSTSYTETELSLTNETHSFLLNKAPNGVFITYTELATGITQNTRLAFVKSIKISKLDTIVLNGNKNGSSFIYRVPVKSTFQIFFNDEYLEKNWFKEVITYALQ